ncbi:MAG: branched-chain amino acid ABC transporter permease [Ardenticatenia bacterium]|nr:MAG: branched-chain amino acid ABC transporter permease [Ardenticatenia bacterium]
MPVRGNTMQAPQQRDRIYFSGLTVLVLLFGVLEVWQPAGITVSTLTGGILTFNTLTRIGILTIVVVGLNLLMGYAGQVSLGQAAFYGLGAYTSAILTTRAHLLGIPKTVVETWWWPWLLILVGILLTALFAYLVGKPILRLKGHYLAMATLGLGIMVYILFRENFGFRATTLNITGGFDGIFDIPRLRIGSLELWPLERYYFVVWGVALLAIAFALNIANSRVGRALRALHGSDIAAEMMGIDTADYKLRTFVLSAIYASIAGSLYAHFQAAVSPGPFHFLGSLSFVVMAAVGGMHSIWGAPLGVSIILFIQDFLRAKGDVLLAGVGNEAEPIIFGLVLILIMIFMPQGVIQVWDRWFPRRVGGAG